MKLQTQVTVPTPERSFGHKNTFVSLGSCFAAEIGNRLENALFDCLTNPLGNLFNPLALSEVLTRAIEDRPFDPSEFFEHLEIWRHFLVHSSLASTDKERSVQTANEALATLRQKLIRCNLLILTLGSAWVYQKAGYEGAIGHNHRLPLSDFEKRRLSPDEISHALESALEPIRRANPSLKICVTVSPVRHARDGLHENNLSKSSLLLAIDQLSKGNQAWEYFPAFELLIDELRDYRFYAEDLVHPSPQAIDYIWDKFRNSYFCEDALTLMKEAEAIQSMLNHRTHHTDTSSYAEYKKSLLKKIQDLNQTLPAAARFKESWQQLP